MTTRTYTVNGHQYSVDDFQYGPKKFGIQFFTSDKYFIKEYHRHQPTKKGIPINRNSIDSSMKILKFYGNHYNKDIYNAPKLIEYQLTKSKAKFVFENIGTKNLKELIMERPFNNEDGRELLKLILEATLPLEQNKIYHGDLRLHNMALKDDKVYILDFDNFGHKENLLIFVINALYNLNHAYVDKKVLGHKSIKGFQDIKEYHPCCRDVAQAIIDNKVSSISDILDLMKAAGTSNEMEDQIL